VRDTGRTQRMLEKAAASTAMTNVIVGHSPHFALYLQTRFMEIVGRDATLRRSTREVVMKDGRRFTFASASDDLDGRFVRGVPSPPIFFYDHAAGGPA
jgi:hypothetical protein